MEPKKKAEIRVLLEKLFRSYTIEELNEIRETLNKCTLEELRERWMYS